MLFLFFRIFFMLVASYLQLVINVIFAPVLILPNVIPGNESFKNWLKRIVGHLLVFPVTIILLVVVQLIALNDQSLNGTGANPREFTQFTLPLIYMETSQFVPIIAGAFLLLIPDLVKKVRDSVAGDSIIQAGPSVLFSGLDTAVGAAFGQYTGLAAVNRTFAGQGPLGKVLNRFYEGKKDRTSTTPPAAIDPAGGNN
jgi:hypothetical protein